MPLAATFNLPELSVFSCEMERVPRLEAVRLRQFLALESRHLGSSQALPFTCCVTLHKSLSLSEIRWHRLRIRDRAWHVTGTQKTGFILCYEQQCLPAWE